MTVSTTSNRINQSGNGVSTVFAFPYKFIQAADIKVYVNNALVTTGYTVGTPTDTGANITFTAAPANGATIVIISDPARTQPTSLPSTGPFPAKTVETALDKLTLLVQRLADLVSRSFTLSDGDTSAPTTTLPLVSSLKGAVLAFNATTGAPEAGPTVAAVGTVAANSAAINSVAANIGEVQNASANAATATTQAGIATTQAGISTTQAGISTAAATSASANAASASSSASQAQAYVGNIINNPILGDDVFSGNCSTTIFTLSRSVTASTETALLVTISGVVQAPTVAYTASGTTLTFTSAPPTGTNNIRVRYIGALAVNSALAQTAATQAAASAASAGGAEIVYTVDGLGNVPTVGSKGFIEIPFNCTINSWTLLADQAGSITVDVKKSSYSGFPTTASITASATPALSSAQKAQSSTLTGWTTTLSAGDILEYVVTGTPATLTRATLNLKVTRT